MLKRCVLFVDLTFLTFSLSWTQPIRPRHAAKLEGGNYPEEAGATSGSHTYQTVFNQKVAGYTTHVFSDDLGSLTTNFIGVNSAGVGSTIHTFTVTKGAGRVAV